MWHHIIIKKSFLDKQETIVIWLGSYNLTYNQALSFIIDLGSRQHRGLFCLFSQGSCKDPLWVHEGMLMWRRCVPASIVPYCEPLENLWILLVWSSICPFVKCKHVMCGYFVTSWLICRSCGYILYTNLVVIWNIVRFLYSLFQSKKLPEGRDTDGRISKDRCSSRAKAKGGKLLHTLFSIKLWSMQAHHMGGETKSKNPKGFKTVNNEYHNVLLKCLATQNTGVSWHRTISKQTNAWEIKWQLVN